MAQRSVAPLPLWPNQYLSLSVTAATSLKLKHYVSAHGCNQLRWQQRSYRRQQTRAAGVRSASQRGAAGELPSRNTFAGLEGAKLLALGAGRGAGSEARGPRHRSLRSGVAAPRVPPGLAMGAHISLMQRERRRAAVLQLPRRRLRPKRRLIGRGHIGVLCRVQQRIRRQEMAPF